MVRYSGGKFIAPGNCRRWRPSKPHLRRFGFGFFRRTAFGSGVANQLSFRPTGCARCTDDDLTMQSRRRVFGYIDVSSSSVFYISSTTLVVYF
jgi:hypothetical protein